MSFFSKIFGAKANSNSDGSKQEEFRYCPKCSSEYRSDFSVCAHCEVALVDKKNLNTNDVVIKRDSKSMEISATDKLVGVQQGLLNEIKRQKRILEKAGIPAIIYADPGAGGG